VPDGGDPLASRHSHIVRPASRRLVGSESTSGHFGEETNFLLFAEQRTALANENNKCLA
jgi:hypothetical protein